MLTSAQQRILEDVTREGKKVYNARARSAIEALERAGYIDVEWDMDITARGDARWRITVTLRKEEA